MGPALYKRLRKSVHMETRVQNVYEAMKRIKYVDEQLGQTVVQWRNPESTD